VSKNKEFIQETIKVWQPHYEESLTEVDAEEIINTTVTFFNTLARWQKKKKQNSQQ